MLLIPKYKQIEAVLFDGKNAQEVIDFVGMEPKKGSPYLLAFDTPALLAIHIGMYVVKVPGKEPFRVTDSWLDQFFYPSVVICVVCGEPIKVTGSGVPEGPCHVQCFHKWAATTYGLPE